jgi:hypothetical protein
LVYEKYNIVGAMLFTIFVHAQKTEVKSAIENFFEAFHANDSVKLKEVCFDGMILQTISENSNGGKLMNESVSAFYKAIGTIRPNLKLEKKILSYSIQVDGTLAHAWTPYEFYVNDKLSHKGVNAFTLFKENDSWKIIHLIDTRRK